jgi:uncharacterized membrane-anchored protein
LKEVVVISGKGGTGKTSIVASFAALAKNVVFADCDVDAADLHLVLEPKIMQKSDFSGGELKNPAGVKNIASNCDLLIAADGGARHLVGLGLQPRIIIGNMDSLTVDRWNNENYTVWIPHSPDKDKSDQRNKYFQGKAKCF